ncbi:MAG: beta-ketoacyl synthase N-terminal-like domain-containing protein, partial [Desulfatitalea sp.]
ALAGGGPPPDAIVLGTTTGGILTTETFLEKGVTDPDAYRYHALGSVAGELARRCGCRGPLLTVSTACSSGAVALALAMEMLRNGRAKRVLAGGADALCRLTYFGFKSLQLIDPLGARPLDQQRRGMSVAEGAAFLLLTSERPSGDALQLLGAGLSCDAHHAAAPLPDGQGARAAMQAALEDAGLSPAQIDYINLHGTGTIDNDLAEARAISALFGDHPPPLSSIKGATGHPLAAAGAIEAVVAAIAVRHGLVPANVGLGVVDPQLNILPTPTPLRTPIATVLSNSFGFGGNNAAVVIGTPRGSTGASGDRSRPPLTVTAAACLTGVGYTQATWEAFSTGRPCGGCLDDPTLAEGLPPRTIRRLKRLPKLALALASRACREADAGRMPVAISLGTAWGALSETHDFLQRLFETGQQFPSPTDFIGSVHNAPAGQIAMLLGAKGANVTTSGGDVSFEQALLAAELLTPGPILVVGADEGHSVLSPLLDGSVRAAAVLADGGGALLLQRGCGHDGPTIALLAYGAAPYQGGMAGLVAQLGGAQAVGRDYGAIWAGIPAACRGPAADQLAAFLGQSRFAGPVIDYRPAIGEFGAASAVAAVLAVEMVGHHAVPAAWAGGAEIALNGKGVLLLGLGPHVSAVRIALP